MVCVAVGSKPCDVLRPSMVNCRRAPPMSGKWLATATESTPGTDRSRSSKVVIEGDAFRRRPVRVARQRDRRRQQWRGIDDPLALPVPGSLHGHRHVGDEDEGKAELEREESRHQPARSNGRHAKLAADAKGARQSHVGRLK